MAQLDRHLKIAYFLFFLLMVLVSRMHLATILVATLFAYLALHVLLYIGRNRVVTTLLFSVILITGFWGTGVFVKNNVHHFIDIASQSIPILVEKATENGIELPFSDAHSLKTVVVEQIASSVKYITAAVTIASKESLYVLFGGVVAIGIFLNPEIEHDRKPQQLSIFSLYCGHLSSFFASLYQSFQTVMGAQVVISAINTILTAAFAFASNMPYAPLVVVITFLCGLLPVIGNLISNTIIFCIASTVSVSFAWWALLYLIVIHKLEYFLNSKIIGSRIRQPMWLTLIALLLGERLFGIAGVVLAPVFLHFIKIEGSRFEVTREDS